MNTPPRLRTALLLGLDEAGYGPFLGPLCVGAAVLRAPLGDATRPPDLWRLLSAAVCREPKESTARTPRVCVNDSKALKRATRAGDNPHAAALADIELSLLAFLAAKHGGCVADDASLFAALRCAALEREAVASPRALPLNHDGALVRLRSGALSVAMARAGVSLESLVVHALPAREFNGACERLGSKAAITLRDAHAALRSLWGSLASETHEGEGPAIGYAFLDRQGGRTDYADLLASVDAGATMLVKRRTPAQCAYVLRDDRREMRVLVEVGADSRRFPVALASMAAKYARDLSMLRFNAEMGLRFPEVKPTQGYGVDAKRWIREASALLSGPELDAIVRRR